MFRWGVGSRDVAALSVAAMRPGTRLASAVEQIRQWRPGLPMLASLAAGALLATLTTTLLENWVTDMLLRDTVARASDQLELGVLGTITPADFEPPFDSRRLDTFAAQLEPITSQLLRQGSGLIRVNLFARDGTLLYSDTPARRGEVLDPDEAQLLKSALEGKPASQRSSLSGPENADLRSYHSSALEAYVPVTIDGDIVGAYELYQDLSGVRSLMLVAWIFVLGITTALIALAAQFARSSDTSKTIGKTRKPGAPSPLRSGRQPRPGFPRVSSRFWDC